MFGFKPVESHFPTDQLPEQKVMKRISIDIDKKIISLRKEIINQSKFYRTAEREKVILHNFYSGTLEKIRNTYPSKNDENLLLEELNLIYSNGDSIIIEYATLRIDSLYNATMQQRSELYK